MVNGASLTTPHLEPYLIKCVHMALDHIEDPQLRVDAKAYVAQEGQHYRQHRRFNDLLIAQGYDELPAIEDQMQREFEGFLAKRSLKFNLAYTAGFETMALAVGHWLSDEREHLFGGSDPRVASLILWHFVEEIEHKNVAVDVYRAVYDGNVWIIVTSDHGQNLGDDTQVGYGSTFRKRKMSCHDFNTRIPFVILPSRKTGTPRSIRGACSNIDVVPTVADILGRELPYASPGRSLLAAMRGDQEALDDHPVYSKVSAFGNASDSVVIGDHKLMRFRDPRSGKVKRNRLFDLASDPRETLSLNPRDARMKAALVKMSGSHGLVFDPAETALSDNTEEKLKSLGYLE